MLKKVSCIFKNARSATIEIGDEGIFHTKREYEVYVNDAFYQKTDRVITGIYDLQPSSDYKVRIVAEDEQACIEIKTDEEFVTLNVRDFGAKGDGITDDTLFIQSAIMACPKKGRVLIPEGTYKVTSLFLKDDLNLELAQGAVLSAETDRRKFPIYPGLIQSWDETEEYNLGTWEGNPLPMFSAIITGVNVKHVVIYGKGVIDGNANFDEDNWWYQPKVKRIAFRPRMLFLNHCEDVVVAGILRY